MYKTELLVPGKFYHIYNCGINGEDLFKMQNDYERFLSLYERFIEPICETYAWVLMKNHFHLFVKVRENRMYKYSNEDGSIDKERFNEIKWETIDLTDFIMDGFIQVGKTSGLELNNLSASEGPDSVKASVCDADGSSTPSGLHLNNLSASAGPDRVKKFIPQPHLHFSHFFNAYAKYYNKKYNRHGSLFERQFKRKEVDNKRYFRTVIIYIHQNPVHHGFCDHPMEYGWSSYLTCVSVRPTRLKRQEVIGWFDHVGNFKYYHEKRQRVVKIEAWLGL